MRKAIDVAVLAENTAGSTDVLAEHGMAWWIDTGSKRILFDTGQGLVLKHNAAAMGISLASADTVALSHGHYDHSGGLATALAAAPGAGLFLHPAAIETKFSRRPAGAAPAGLRPDDRHALDRHAGHITWTTGPTEIADGVHLTGQVPRVTDFEDTGGAFFLDEVCTRPDPLIDDQTLFFETGEGLVVLFGCAHAGAVNTLRYIRELTGKPIHTVAGGMHLVRADARRMDLTIEAFRHLDIKRIAPSHCTGMPAVARFWREFPDRCFACPAGTRMQFER